MQVFATMMHCTSELIGTNLQGLLGGEVVLRP